jgi:hypothetical protein
MQQENLRARSRRSKSDMPADPKVIEGKSSKLDLNDPNECFRIYARMIRVGS